MQLEGGVKWVASGQLRAFVIASSETVNWLLNQIASWRVQISAAG